MEKILHFDSPRETYRADAAVIWCYDSRFEMAFRKLLKKTGIVCFDAIRLAGGAKSLATPDGEAERQLVLDQLRKSMRLHRTDRVLLMVHSDCGAYGGLDAFGGDTKAELSHHKMELRRAAAYLREALPELTVVCYFVDFEGVWRIDADGAAKG